MGKESTSFAQGRTPMVAFSVQIFATETDDPEDDAFDIVAFDADGAELCMFGAMDATRIPEAIKFWAHRDVVSAIRLYVD